MEKLDYLESKLGDILTRVDMLTARRNRNISKFHNTKNSNIDNQENMQYLNELRRQNSDISNQIDNFYRDIREIKELYYDLNRKFQYGNAPMMMPSQTPVPTYQPQPQMQQQGIPSESLNTELVNKISNLQNDNIDLLKKLNKIESDLELNKQVNQMGMMDPMYGYDPYMYKNTQPNNDVQSEDKIDDEAIIKTIKDITLQFQKQNEKLSLYEDALRTVNDSTDSKANEIDQINSKVDSLINNIGSNSVDFNSSIRDINSSIKNLNEMNSNTINSLDKAINSAPMENSVLYENSKNMSASEMKDSSIRKDINEQMVQNYNSPNSGIANELEDAGNNSNLNIDLNSDMEFDIKVFDTLPKNKKDFSRVEN